MSNDVKKTSGLVFKKMGIGSSDRSSTGENIKGENTKGSNTKADTANSAHMHSTRIDTTNHKNPVSMFEKMGITGSENKTQSGDVGDSRSVSRSAADSQPAGYKLSLIHI